MKRSRLEPPERPPDNRPVLSELIWGCAVFGVPLGSGLVVDATVGWWPGLAAFFVAAMLIGVLAYRADRHRRSR